MTTKISNQEFARRRRDLMAQMEPNSIAIVPAALEKIRNRDVEFPFRQDSDFYYLTGFPEPDAVLVLLPGREHGEVVVFCRERDPTMELWNGYRAGPEGVCARYGADDAFPISDMDEILPGLIEGRERVYYAMGRNADFDRRVMQWINVIRSKVRAGAHPPGEFLVLDHLLHDLRLFKSAGELRLMKEAGQISARAHYRAMTFCKPGMYEYQLEAEILHEFGRSGSRSPAYGSIVGAGANGCILHYRENDAQIRDGDLVLIDAGCELEHYASDITRTFPANGKFNKEQQALYEIALEAQFSALATIKPGAHWNEAHDAAVKTIAQGLKDLGLLEGDLKEIIETETYKRFYMHRTGHWLGMDVHDVGDYKVGGDWRVLEPNMVMTVEPGIYVSPHDNSVARKWRGIGIRIEDDAVVTKKGCEVLTNDVPKTVRDIEKLMKSRAA
jgi:Xaa-Pro aminopeptidase